MGTNGEDGGRRKNGFVMVIQAKVGVIARSNLGELREKREIIIVERGLGRAAIIRCDLGRAV